MQDMPRTSIHDLGQCVDMTLSVVNCFVMKELNLEELDVSVWSKSIAEKWVHQRIEDELNSRLRWTKSYQQADDILNDTIVAFIKSLKGGRTLLDRFYETLDVAELFISSILDEAIGDHDWLVWHTHHRHDWVVFEPGEDYRIKVFNEKVASGEWEV